MERVLDAAGVPTERGGGEPCAEPGDRATGGVSVATPATRLLVIGGTGRQGRAVVECLGEQSGYELSVLTRSPAGETARELSRQGVTVIEGDLLDPESVARAMTGVDRAFFITDYPLGGDPFLEVRQGQNVVEAAEDADLDQLVYSSTMDATVARNVPHFGAKATVEATVCGADVRSTILRPAPFYQNLRAFAGAIRAGFVPFPIDSTTELPMVDVRDIGTAGAAVLSEPATHAGGVHRVVARTYTLRELARQLQRAHGVTMTPVPVPLAVIKRLTDASVASMFAWFRRYGRFRGAVGARLDIGYRGFGEFVDSASFVGTDDTPHWMGRVTAPLRPPFG